MMRFINKGTQDNLATSSTSQFIEEGDPQNLSYGSMSPVGIISSDLFWPLICHLNPNKAGLFQGSFS